MLVVVADVTFLFLPAYSLNSTSVLSSNIRVVFTQGVFCGLETENLCTFIVCHAHYIFRPSCRRFDYSHVIW
jgi:hypothetical protein